PDQSMLRQRRSRHRALMPSGSERTTDKVRLGLHEPPRQTVQRGRPPTFSAEVPLVPAERAKEALPELRTTAREQACAAQYVSSGPLRLEDAGRARSKTEREHGPFAQPKTRLSRL